MKKLLCLILAVLMLIGMTACNVTQGSILPGDNSSNPNASFTPTPPDEFAPPIGEDEYDDVIGGDTAAAICTFLYKTVIPIVIYLSTTMVLFGLLAMYLAGEYALTAKKKISKHDGER